MFQSTSPKLLLLWPLSGLLNEECCASNIYTKSYSSFMKSGYIILNLDRFSRKWFCRLSLGRECAGIGDD